MTVNELRQIYRQQGIQEAEIVHDAMLPGWIVEFRGEGGRLFELTDSFGLPLSFGTVDEARDHIHKVADCPIQVEHLYHFFER
ncbi:hypothetical protein [Aeromonas molluscorum]|jgi:hypothetical protein|uniref:Thymidylate kinase n=1 Tax=Aeromonas molluscorum 848 TaxID=1268236 RepID=R1FB80_9GAMM|nr:hypothetical protein [Aeromonas molluscorum]EOD56922.1 hypothetical protein G113_01519 [Aeromonas molluscorum 848]